LDIIGDNNSFDLELEQSEVKIIFLQGELEERIFMKQPEWYFQEE